MSPLDRTSGLPAGGGNGMAAMIAGHQWAETSLGAQEAWPQSLRAVIALMVSSRFAMWMSWGPELTFFYNDAYAPTLGVKHGWALGRPSREVWAEIWPDIGPRIEHVLTTGEATWDEALLLFLERRGYREETYHTFSYSPLRDDAGGIAGHLCVVTEETERVISERRLRTLRELAAGLAEASSEADALAAVARSLGGNPRDLPFTLTYLLDEPDGFGAGGRLAAESGFADGRPDVARVATTWPIEAIRSGAATIHVDDLPAGLPTGSWSQSPAQALVVAIASPGQEHPAGCLIAGLNPHRLLDAAYIDFLKLLAGQIASALGNARAYETERRRSKALAELDRAKTAFFSNVSHEFRTPLTLMLGPLQDALEQSNTATVAELRPMLEMGHRNAQRLLRLVNTLLDFSRIEAERVQARYRPTDLAALTADLAAAFRSAMQRAGLRFVVDCPPIPEPVFVDPEMWEKIVLNLLSNAFKFTFAGEVRVAVQRDGDAALLSVRDSGTGIPADHLARVFERFHRIEGSRGRSHEGSGIGLALVRDLVALHGGTITVESEPDRGSTFRVRIPFGSAHLPPTRIVDRRTDESASALGTAFAEEALTWLSDAGDDAIARNETVGDVQQAAREAPGTGRILLADDNADMRGYVQRLLEAAGHHVASVTDGQAALDHLRAHHADLVLSDVMMPRLDGLGLLRTIRGEAALRHLPVILLSARAGEDAKIEGFETQADDYLIKPFSGRELLARVGANLAVARVRRQALDEQRELTERLRESEARFRMVGDTAPVLIWMSDETGGRTWFNKPWLAFTGRSMEQELGSGWTETLHSDDFERCLDIQRAHVERREPFRMDCRMRRNDGVWRLHDDSGVPRFGSDGTFIGYIGSLVDVTEARAAEAALRRLNETLETRVAERTAERDRLWELSEDLLVVADYDGRLLRISPSWTRLLGHTERHLLSVGYDTIVHPDDLPAGTEALLEMRRTGLPARFESRFSTADGGYRWIAWALSPEADGPTLFGVGRDVTSERAARDALLAQIEERELIEATLRQMQRLEAVGQLTSGVAHDFNNLLTVILGNLEYVGRETSDPKTLRRLDLMRTAARRGANLTAQLLAFSRKQHLDPKPLDLNETVRGMNDLLRSTIGGTVKLEIALRDELWPALVDRTQLELVILNLAINARDAMPVGGTLTIATGGATLGEPERAEDPAAGEYVLVAVADAGTGMSQDVLDRAFEPFFTTKEPGRGSGLGLPQVFGFAKQSGGGVRIETRLGGGTTVRVFLPRAPMRQVAEAPDQPAERSRPVTGGQRRALLVDDDDAVREVTRAMLEDIGFMVTDEAAGAAALARLESGAGFDVALIDFAMPGMNGAELAGRIEQHRPDLPILLVTGFADTQKLQEAGNWPVIAKPFLPDQLARAIGQALDFGRRSTGATRQAVDVEGS